MNDNFFSVFGSFVVILTSLVEATRPNDSLLCITVATKETDGYLRFMRSASVNGLTPKVLGMGKPWKGGDMNQPGGGYKINLLRKELEKHKHKENSIILFSDSYDVIFTAGEEEILKQFYSFNSSIVFSSEDFCWPDQKLEKDYPTVLHGYRFLNSGGFIGYAPKLYELVSKDIEDTADDQLYYTRAFLDPNIRTRLDIKLDTQAKIFQNLHGNIGDVALDFGEDDTHLINTVYHTTPPVIHGNGLSKMNINSLGNYLAKSWTKSDGCLACSEGRINLHDKKETEYPLVLIGIFISSPTPFIEEMLNKVTNLLYPKSRIYLFVYNNVESHEKVVKKWISKQIKNKYIDLKYMSSKDQVEEWKARTSAIDVCLDNGCDVFFNVDSEVHLDNPYTLNLLISYNRSVLAPVITQVGKLWSSFWGAVNEDGYYARSSDYMDIINGVRKGIWNVPYIYGCYVIWRKVLADPDMRPNYKHKSSDQDISFAFTLRDKGVFMYAVNLQNNYGHLVNMEAVSTDHLYNDLWQIAANSFDWESKYLHPDYYKSLNSSFVNEMACPDVYWFPVFTERFCIELIKSMENLGEWSGGKNEDSRLAGGYENVPTDDIHMTQLGFEQEWLYFLKYYIKPLAEKVFLGYTSDATAIMNFVVRYKPTVQPFLRPHHDSSTYTINIGLNRPGIDYEGGGARFIRQNCSVTNTKQGWALMHPGRLTHYHEGLPTIKGTRYIMVSFIDP